MLGFVLSTAASEQSDGQQPEERGVTATGPLRVPPAAATRTGLRQRGQMQLPAGQTSTSASHLRRPSPNGQLQQQQQPAAAEAAGASRLDALLLQVQARATRRHSGVDFGFGLRLRPPSGARDPLYVAALLFLGALLLVARGGSPESVSSLALHQRVGLLSLQPNIRAVAVPVDVSAPSPVPAPASAPAPAPSPSPPARHSAKSAAVKAKPSAALPPTLTAAPQTADDPDPATATAAEVTYVSSGALYTPDYHVHCVPPHRLPQAGDVLYSICGSPHRNLAEFMCVVTMLCLTAGCAFHVMLRGLSEGSPCEAAPPALLLALTPAPRAHAATATTPVEPRRRLSAVAASAARPPASYAQAQAQDEAHAKAQAVGTLQPPSAAYADTAPEAHATTAASRLRRPGFTLAPVITETTRADHSLRLQTTDYPLRASISGPSIVADVDAVISPAAPASASPSAPAVSAAAASGIPRRLGQGLALPPSRVPFPRPSGPPDPCPGLGVLRSSSALELTSAPKSTAVSSLNSPQPGMPVRVPASAGVWGPRLSSASSVLAATVSSACGLASPPLGHDTRSPPPPLPPLPPQGVALKQSAPSGAVGSAAPFSAPFCPPSLAAHVPPIADVSAPSGAAAISAPGLSLPLVMAPLNAAPARSLAYNEPVPMAPPRAQGGPQDASRQY